MDNAFMGEIRLLPYMFAPESWMECAGQQLSVSQYQALFSIIEYRFGGSGDVFMLPDLRDRTVIGAGQGVGLTPRTLGETGGQAEVALNIQQIPPHQHTWVGCSTLADSNQPTSGVLANVPQTREFKRGTGSIESPTGMSATMTSNVGNGTAHENRQPFLVLRFCICVSGMYPTRP